MTEEIWKPVPGTEGRYEASNLGRIRSHCRWQPWLMKPNKSSDGYLFVHIYYEVGKRKDRFVHRLVMEAFHGPSTLEVNHLNGVIADNRLENLEYCTSLENRHHRMRREGRVPGHPYIVRERKRFRLMVYDPELRTGKRLGYFKTLEAAEQAKQQRIESLPAA